MQCCSALMLWHCTDTKSDQVQNLIMMLAHSQVYVCCTLHFGIIERQVTDGATLLYIQIHRYERSMHTPVHA